MWRLGVSGGDKKPSSQIINWKAETNVSQSLTEYSKRP